MPKGKNGRTRVSLGFQVSEKPSLGLEIVNSFDPQFEEGVGEIGSGE